MKEYTGVRQEGDGFRRLFLSESLQLYVRYTEDRSSILGFQLVYFSGNEQKALTWRQGEGFTHAEVDGWDSGRFNKTPLLVQDGIPDFDAIRSLFCAEVEGIDKDVADFVRAKLE
ncbi:hypothetical protein MASR2M78_03260 [Treponema sp.]